MDQITLRLMARHAQLQRAVRQDEVKDVARAGARARLASLELLPSERAAAQHARAMVGRALREARLRAKQPKADLSLIAAPVAKRRSRRLRAVALVTLVLLLALLLWEVVPGAPTSTTVAEDPGGSLAGGAVAQTQASEKSRGRTVDLVVAVTAEASPAPEPSPAATPGPPAAPAVAGSAGAAGGAGGQGQGGGGSGTGSGPGSGSGLASATPAPTPAPTATPVPEVVPGSTRIRGRVVDSATGKGVAGVCLVPGSLDCDAEKPHSDANGYWVIDVTSGTYWDIRFQIDNYRVTRIRVFAGGRETNVGNVRITRAVS